ncbi:MAG TPA: putative sugar nucleotidyl transferase [Candidatus Sulfotelmatobacter sp.]|nr:putative sugar nucleotidyl transferase [Candidatus Sulfotelmatobacter sp.]
MITGILLFEDAGWRELRPLTDTLPVPALRFGASDLGRRWLATAGVPLVGIEARAEVMAAWESRPADASSMQAEILAVNAAALPGDWLEAARESRGAGVWRSKGRMVAARLSSAALAPLRGSGVSFPERLTELELPAQEIEAAWIRFPWHLIERNTQALVEELEGVSGNDGEVHPSAVLLNAERISIARGARVDPLAVLDARAGPIAIGAGAFVQAHTLVVGPCAVGDRTQLLGGVIANSTIGPECRISGEVDASIWQGYANKRHHGFVGHSVIGEWVNLGALTTTSDLKNNYGSVRIWVDGREVDSGNPKVGSVIGAHVKTGIGTLLPTGASIGVGSNLFGGGQFAPKHLPPFSWWDGHRSVVHELDRFLATARVALSRRGRKLSDAEERLLRHRFESTVAERDRG